MHDAVSIITPAYKASAHIGRTVQSVLGQSVADWEMLIIADDGDDYEAVLGRQGIADPRLVFLSTGKTGGGASAARNIGLARAQHRFGAILDADDYWQPDKLTRCLAHVVEYGIVSTALEVVDAQLHPLRTIGAGPDKFLSAGDYKFTNISMDSMLVYDRQRCDARYDETFPHLTDIDFVLKLFAKSDGCFHIGSPLHAYVKEPQAMSNAPGASARIGAAKKRLLSLLRAGHYPLADADGVAGLIDFYEASLLAEAAYPRLLAQDQSVLFEDHLEQILASKNTNEPNSKVEGGK